MVTATAQTIPEKMTLETLLKEFFVIKDVDLGYDKRQNVMLSCSVDGCNRISYCSCDCNDGPW